MLSKNDKKYTEEEIELIEDEALSWMIKIQEAPDDLSLLSEFNSWLYKSALHAKIWDEFGHVSDGVRHFSDVKNKTHSHSHSQTTTSPSPDRNKIKAINFQKYAAMVGLLFISALMLSYLPKTIQLMNADHSTSVGEVRQFELPDGSLINLGANSAINVDFKNNDRKIELLAGQAFFEVKKSPDRPFKVITEKTETIVTGTSFEVDMGLDSTIVSVEEGTVWVKQTNTPPKGMMDKTNELLKGDSLQINSSGETSSSFKKLKNIAAWRSGKLVVFDRPVKEVVYKLKQHYRGLVVNGLGSIGNKRISGVFDLNEPAKAIKTIAGAHGAKTRQISKWIIIISRI